MISAVIFDFDGIIVDSERLHFAAFSKVLAPRGKSFSGEEYVETFIGFDDRDTFRTACPNISGAELNKLITEKAAAFQHLLETEGAPALPGAAELIKKLSGSIPIAICSGALREDIMPVLVSLGIDNAFDAIVTADDTHISKPDPAPYRLAMERLAVAAPDGRGITRRAAASTDTRRPAASTGVEFAVAIEDTPAGIASAKGAGLRVLAVTNSYEKEALKQADRIVDSLEGLTLEKLHEIF